MAKLTDMQIKAWMQAGERFELRSDGNGLGLRYRDSYAIPVWVLRYSIKGERRQMVMGSYADLSLAEARKTAKEMNARVALGYDVAAEKQTRKAEAVAAIEAGKTAITVGQLADEYFERMILGRWKHPNIVRSRIEKDIKPSLGKLKVEDVKPRHIDDMLQKIVRRGAPTVANDVLRWVRRMFDYGIKRHMLEINPASAFDLSDAGGKEDARERALSRDELAALFQAMPNAKGFSVENDLSIKLLLLLCVRKMELLAARWDEFDLPNAVWHLPAERAKTGKAISIPLPALALEWLETLKRLSGVSPYVLPARKMQNRMLPHVCESTLSVALSKVKHGLEPFTIHDLRRTARTHLAALGVLPDIAERCLNHKRKGVEGIYNQHDYFDERRDALNKWAALLNALITSQPYNVVPLNLRKKTA